MKRKKKFAQIFGLLFFCFLFSSVLALEELSPQYKEWLQNVSPIITKVERQVFLKLRTNEEREKFIQLFWRHRDPKPDTLENEFYKEYMERIRFADQNFGRATSRRGSQTERGYYYLLLGPPLERNFFTTHSQVWPLELWFYKGQEEFGLPPFFYLIFFQPEGQGDYRLYSPGIDGPEKLAVPSLYGRTDNRQAAYQVIKKISSELASASLSYLPGEKPLGMASFSSDLILAGIRFLPEKKFSDSYARSYLSYKDYVETEYSDRFIESGFRVNVFKNAGQFFVHWAAEPRKINFAETDAGLVYASFELVMRMEDSRGNLVFEKQEEIPLKITAEQYKAHERQIFSFQNVFPVISGNFRLFFLLKNKTARDFTSFTADISAPEDSDKLQLSRLLLYQKREKLAESGQKPLKAFAFEGVQYIVSSRDEFPPQAEVGFYVQVYGGRKAVADSATSVLLEVRSSADLKVVLSSKKPAAEVIGAEGVGLDLGFFPLASLKPGYYQAEVSLIDSGGNKITAAKENFILLSQPYPVIPWVYSRVHAAFPNADTLSILSSQYFLTGQYEKAMNFAQQAFQMKDDPAIRLLLAKSFYALGRYQDSLTVIGPVYEKSALREAAKLIAADYAGLKDWSSALIYLEKLMKEATEAGVLNLAAECYLNLNQPERALPLLQKSLEINPNQPAIREMEEKAKKNKK